MPISKHHIYVISTSLLLITFGLSAQAADGLLLWNKLGSTDEVTNSFIGPSFQIHQDGGDTLFVDGLFEGALATTGGTANTGPAGGYLSINPDLFFPADKTKGTVEFWIQKQVDRFTPYQSPLVTYFGRQRYATGYNSISAGWADGTPNSTYFSVYTEGGWSRVEDSDWESIPVGQWVHLAFVWDGSGIEGGADDLQLYRDGVLVDSHQGRFTSIVPTCCVGYSCGESYCSSGGYEVRILANHEGRRLTGCSEYPSGYCPSAYMDNIKVWDYAKTDFSDRLSVEVAIDIKPGSDPNCFNINGHGVIPVAILGDSSLDVSRVNIDPDSDNPLSFNGLDVRVRGKKGPLCSIELINEDEFADLICHFEDDTSQWVTGTENSATLTGELVDGTPIQGSGSICIVP